MKTATRRSRAQALSIGVSHGERLEIVLLGLLVLALIRSITGS
jgi:hypothetical protein